MLKSLIDEERIVTTTAKAKELRRHADRMITIAKKDSLAARRDAIGRLMIRFNTLTTKEARNAKKDDKSGYNRDRRVIEKLFATLGPRFSSRQGGYTRLIRSANRVGDAAPLTVIEYLSE
jgi:large subunit ribosomal protein L17